MNALHKTTEEFPEESSKYFSSVDALKQTLAEQLSQIDVKSTLKRHHGKASPKLAAYHLLDYTQRLFAENSRPQMSQWCKAAKEMLAE